MTLPTDDFRLDPGEIHVWHAKLEDAGGSPDDMAVLDDAERERAARLLRPLDRAHFIAAHACARRLIGRYLGCAPEAVRFGKGEQGKPHILHAEGQPGLCFNASRTGGYAAFAFSRTVEIGIDVEEITVRAGMDLLMQRALCENERLSLNALSESERARMFFTYWARKEAYLKARGLGFAIPPNRVDTSASQALRVQDAPEPDWRVEDVVLTPGYAAAVAGEGREWRVTSVRAVTAPARD